MGSRSNGSRANSSRWNKSWGGKCSWGGKWRAGVVGGACVIAVSLATGPLAIAQQAVGPDAVDSGLTESAEVEPGAIGRTVEAMNPVNWNWPSFKPPQWKMPQLLPAREDRERIVKKNDSLWSDVATTTQQSWNKTKQVLHPRKLNPMNWWSAPSEPSRPVAPKSPGFFGSLFGPADQPEERVADVTDFLGQDRPDR